MKISAHTLVKNESRFIWYSVMSVIKHVDRYRIWDTGSTDGTIEIINEIAKTPEARSLDLFEFKKLDVDHFDEAKIRGRMLSHKNEPEQDEAEVFRIVRELTLEATLSDWFIVVDADEVWWEESISEVANFIKGSGENYESIVVPTVNLVGDMFHYQEKQAGKYNLKGLTGNLNLRAVNRKIPGLKSLGSHGKWGWADENDIMIQDRDLNKIKYLNTPYLHATHLLRSSSIDLNKDVYKRSFKYKKELGYQFPLDYYYPEVFFRPKPDGVPCVWENMSLDFKTKSAFLTPLRKLNRRIMPEKVGY